MQATRALDRLFSPTSVAVVGASNYGQKGGGFLLKGLLGGNFQGRVYPVNPNEAEVMGLRSYASVLDIPGEVDLAVIAVGARLVPRVMAECGAKGIKFAIVHSAGFSESGPAGRDLENEVLEIAHQHGIRFVGPNCMGVYCPRTGLNTVIPETRFKDGAGTVAFLGQSGWATEGFIEMGYERGLRFSKVVSIGNQADLMVEDYLQYLAGDAETKVIAGYIEGIKRGREFLQLARQTSHEKPIIVWKGGKTEAGVRAAASHTGSLAGNISVFEAAMKQAGIISAQNLEELVDLTIGFSSPIMPPGNRVGILGESGAGAVASVDIHEALGLQIPTFSLETQEELAETIKGIIPAFPSRHNPIDLVWIPYEHAVRVFFQCARIISKEVDSILIIIYLPLDERFVTSMVGLRDELKKPIFLIPGHAVREKSGMSLLVKKGIPSFATPESALKVLAAMVRYASNRHQG